MPFIEKIIKRRLNRIIIPLVTNGIILILLGIFIIIYEPVLKLTIALSFIVISYILLYLGIMFLLLKKDLKFILDV